MFTISTFDGWVDRSKLLSPDKSAVDPVVACFMCTFIPIVCWVLLPVVVAVLIDNFSCAVANEKIKAIQEEEKSQMKALGLSKADSANPLDPLLEILSRFRNSDDLSRRIGILFRVLDIDLGGTLDFHEIQEGLKKMDHLQPRVHLSSDDYHRMTKGGSLCDQNGQLDAENFDCVFREELEAFMLGKIAKALDESFVNEKIVYDALLQGMKLLLVRSAVAQNRSRSAGNDSTATSPPETATSTLLNELRTLRKELKDAHHDILMIKKENLQRKNDVPLSESKKELTARSACKDRHFENRSQGRSQGPTLDREVANGNNGVQHKEAIDKLKLVNENQPTPTAVLAAYPPSTSYRDSQKHSNDQRETRDSQTFSACLHEINQCAGPNSEGSGFQNRLSKRLSNLDRAAGSRTANHLALNQSETHEFIDQDAPSTLQSQRKSEYGVRFSEHEKTCQSYITIPSSFQADVKYIEHLAHTDSDLGPGSESIAGFIVLEGKSDCSGEHLAPQNEHTYTQYTSLASDRQLLSRTDSGGILTATNVHITAEFVLGDEPEDIVPG